MRAYKALFRIRFTNSLQYRAAAIAGIATNFAWGFMTILAFAAFYRSNPYTFPMTFQQTVAYVWMTQAFIAMFFLWFYDYSIFADIENGNISYELVRPMNLYGRWFTMNAAYRLAVVALRCMPILLVSFIIPEPFRLILPTELWRLGLFFVSMALSLGIIVSFTMLIYISTFSTISSTGTRVVLGIAAGFLSGEFIPIPFFPDTLRTLVELLPFGAMQNMPLLIFSGYLAGEALARGLILQVFWLVALFLLGHALMGKALKRVVVQGG